jgi:hypothetical protein
VARARSSVAKHPFAIGPRADFVGQRTAQGETGIALAHDALHQRMDGAKVLFDEGERGTRRSAAAAIAAASRRRIGLRAPRSRSIASIVAASTRGEAQHPAARADGWQQPARTVGDEQEEGADRRFLKTLEQGVDRAFFQVVGGIDDDHTAAAQRRAV